MASKFQTKTINKLKKKGWTVLKTIRLNESGYPDLICMLNGVTIWIEVKEENDTLKPLQSFRIRELKKNGFDAFVEQDGKYSELDDYLKK
jgi:Holliday junction resolvase